MEEEKQEASIVTLESPSREGGSSVKAAKIDNKDISHQMRIESEASYNDSKQGTSSLPKAKQQFSINKG